MLYECIYSIYMFLQLYKSRKCDEIMYELKTQLLLNEREKCGNTILRGFKNSFGFYFKPLNSEIRGKLPSLRCLYWWGFEKKAQKNFKLMGWIHGDFRRDQTREKLKREQKTKWHNESNGFIALDILFTSISPRPSPLLRECSCFHIMALWIFHEFKYSAL